ncbi:hypothetical protein KKI91_19885 [Xenorhabdus bovienii]|uniref:delta endotoxin C-terminal domain-containing protein n=1 Tax=Xenorhabdus bovienii TaxID=40576 RepID=UPI0023B232DC|nr:delta endotoxin C-terminal domain-containing protein [Xenorhabdus bovienii]MDE9536889.1 hypothetical protein [Xenorhabdus bovienii]
MDSLPVNFGQATQQYHAIRAYKSINDQNLTVQKEEDKKLYIVPGPGFTGGDLVKILPEGTISFILEKDNSREWLNGTYAVRVWYLKGKALPSSSSDEGESNSNKISVSISFNNMQNNNPYNEEEGIDLGSNVDENNIKYDELCSKTLLNEIIIRDTDTDTDTDTKPSIYIEFTNKSEKNHIILDRIELVFVSPKPQYSTP